MLLAISLALGASLVYGLSDFLGGLKSRSLPQLSVLPVTQGAALAVLAAIVVDRRGRSPGRAVRRLRLTTVAAFVAVAVAARPAVRVSRAEVPVLVAIGMLILVADSMYAVASTNGLLGVVAVLSSLYPVVTIALARRWLHEPIERAQALGIALALTGAAAISAASA